MMVRVWWPDVTPCACSSIPCGLQYSVALVPSAIERDQSTMSTGEGTRMMLWALGLAWCDLRVCIHRYERLQERQGQRLRLALGLALAVGLALGMGLGQDQVRGRVCAADACVHRGWRLAVWLQRPIARC